MQQTKKEFEKVIARHCATVLAGLRPAALVNLRTDKLAGAEKGIVELDRFFAAKKIRFEIVKVQQKNILLLCYHQSKLRLTLLQKENSCFLSRMGYCFTLETDTCIGHLKKRLQGNSFPHEIGIFLGYPIEDVCGYLKDPAEAVFSGYWKVYDQPESKQKLFERFKKCSDAVVEKIENGRTLREIFIGGSYENNHRLLERDGQYRIARI